MCLIPSVVRFPALWVDHNWIPCPDHLIVSNGILNLNRLLEGEAQASLTLHTPNFVSKVELPFPFDPQAQCPEWKTFLEEVLPDPESRQLLREVFGYCLTYDTSLQKFFLFEGSGANGKGVVLRILTALLGEANVSSLPLEIFGHSHGLESTLGKLVNISLSDAEILVKAKAAQNGVVFTKLFDGEWKNDYTSQSEADLALCSRLAFWAGPNPEQIDRLFRQSKLYRPKWDAQRGERTYGAMTIEKAIDEVHEFYGKGQDPQRGSQDGSHGRRTSDDSPTIANDFLLHHGLRSDEGLHL